MMILQMDRFKIEAMFLANQYDRVIGCDEVGRGCLAGPVVAAAVVLDPRHANTESWYSEVKDSKSISPLKRTQIARLLRRHSVTWGIGIVSPAIIDKLNIHNASLLAMKRAVMSLDQKSSGLGDTKVMGKTKVIVDGRFAIPNLLYDQDAIVRGDVKVLSISAASIIAKVYRDQLMVRLHKQFPAYQYNLHKGYATAVHRLAIQKNGLTTVHRRSFCGNIL